jgi:ADP-ribose pyrophosphatase YjhB (NUDIX family)
MPSRDRCCGTSVGVLTEDQDHRLLMVTRGWHPIGIAPVAGHVADAHTSVADALVAEVREEVGLEVTGARLLSEAHRTNLCASPPAWPRPGHYWWVYTATATGTVQAAPGETRGAAWYTPDQVRELAAATVEHAVAGRPAADQPLDSLEAVWVEILASAGVVLDPLSGAERAAIRELYSAPPRSYWVGDREIPADEYHAARI